MSTGARLKASLNDARTRRWAVGLSAVAVGHIVVLALVVPTARTGRSRIEAADPIAPVFLDITPRARPARTPPTPALDSSGRPSPAPPIAVRAARPSGEPVTVPPLVVDTAPAPTPRPGRIIPRSWRERCNLPADGVVSDAAWAACQQMFLNAAAPPGGPPRLRGDPAQDFAAQGAARIAAYEAFHAPTPVGGGLAPPSSTPGSNFGMGEMDASVVYSAGSRPQTMGRED